MKITNLFMSAAVLCALSLPLAACKDKGEGSENPGDAEDGDEEDGEKKDPMEELRGVPVAIQGELDMVMQPITDLEKLMADLETAPERLSISAGDLKGMLSASFEGGEAEVSADLDISDEARAEIKAMLELAKGIGPGLKAIPENVAKAAANISAHGVRGIGLAAGLTGKLTAKAKFAKGEKGVALQAQLAEVGQIKADLQGAVQSAAASVKELPAKAAEMGAKFTASIATGG